MVELKSERRVIWNKVEREGRVVKEGAEAEREGEKTLFLTYFVQYIIIEAVSK